MRLHIDRGSAVMLAVALAAGGLAVWTARQYLQGRVHQLEAQARVPTVQRVVAAYDLPAGIRLSSDHLAVRSFPAGLVASDSLPPDAHARLEGSVLKTPLQAGDPVLPAHAVVDRGLPFSARLGQGRRAITMPIDAINSASGLLEPGDLIDLYVSFDHQRKRITAPLLQGVLVLATGSATDAVSEAGGGMGYSTVTLDTAPEDAIKLVAARQSGSITALLRHPDDARPTQKASRGDLASLIGVGQPPVRKPSSRRAPVIYGDRPIRNLASLRPQADGAAADASAASALFDLPYMPELVSAWLTEREGDDGAEASSEGGTPLSAMGSQPLMLEPGTYSH